MARLLEHQSQARSQHWAEAEARDERPLPEDQLVADSFGSIVVAAVFLVFDLKVSHYGRWLMCHR